MQNKKIKVLFLPAWYPNKTDSMAGLFVKYHALAIQPYADVAVLYMQPNPAAQANPIEYDYFMDDGLPTLIVYIQKRTGNLADRLLYPLQYLKGLIKGYKLITEKTGKPDIHHVHILTRAGVPALWQKITKGTPYIITEHWSRYLPRNSSSYKGALRKWLTRKVAKNAALITVVSKHLGEAMQTHGLKNQYHQVSNVVDIHFFKPLNPKPVNAKPLLLHVSCFDEKPKNVKGILDAVKQLEQQGLDFNFRLVGDGKDLNMVKEYTHQLGLKNVEFTGLRTGTELLHEYQTADAFVLFSNFENQPVVILEAFACGLPVVATKVGGIPEVVKENYGVLIDAGDTNALADTLTGIIKKEITFDTSGMRQYAVESFSYEGVGKKFYDLYQQVLNK